MRQTQYGQFLRHGDGAGTALMDRWPSGAGEVPGGRPRDRQLGWGGLVGQLSLSEDRDGRELGGEDYP